MSASWYLFIVLLLTSGRTSDVVLLAWVISLFITFH